MDIAVGHFETARALLEAAAGRFQRHRSATVASLLLTYGLRPVSAHGRWNDSQAVVTATVARLPGTSPPWESFHLASALGKIEEGLEALPVQKGEKAGVRALLVRTGGDEALCAILGQFSHYCADPVRPNDFWCVLRGAQAAKGPVRPVTPSGTAFSQKMV